MPNKLITNFAAGINKAGLQAPPGALEDCFNLWPQAGYLQVMGAKHTITTVPTYTSERIYLPAPPPLGGYPKPLVPRTLENVGDKLFTKMGRIVWQMAQTNTADQLHPFPLIDRTDLTQDNFDEEVISQFRGDWIISPARPELVDQAFRWSGKVVVGDLTPQAKPQVSPGDLTYLVDISAANIRPGSSSVAITDIHPNWVMWLGKYASGAYNWYTCSRVVAVDRTNSILTLAVPQYGSLPYLDDVILNSCNVFCLVEASPLGIPAPAHPHVTRAQVTDSDGLPINSYRYMWRYVSSTHGVASDPSIVSGVIATNATHKQIDVTIDMDEYRTLPYHVDQVEVYRSAAGVGGWDPWYLVHTENIRVLSGASVETIPASIILRDDGGHTVATDWIDGEILPEDAYWNTPPPAALACVIGFNDRLYGVESTTVAGTRIHPFGSGWPTYYPDVVSSRLRFSSRGNADAWPKEMFDVTDYNGLAVDAGGFIDLGGTAKITAIIPEKGSFSDSGLTGDTLLIFNTDYAWRLYGSDMTDFAVYPAFRVGAVVDSTVRNIDGTVFFRGPEHVYASDGGSIPRPISKGLYPNGKSRYGLSDGLNSISHYLIYTEDAWSDGGIGNAYLFDLDTGAWLQIDPASSWTSKPGDPSTLIGVKDDNTWFRYFGEHLNTIWRFKTAPLTLSEDGASLSAVKRVVRIRAGFTNTTGQAQTVTANIYADGNAAVAATKALSVPYVSTAPYQVVHWGLPSTSPPVGKYVQVEMGGTLGVPGSPPTSPLFLIEWIDIEYSAGTPLTVG